MSSPTGEQRAAPRHVLHKSIQLSRGGRGGPAARQPAPPPHLGREEGAGVHLGREAGQAAPLLQGEELNSKFCVLYERAFSI